jgi:hypothetical protein
MDFSSGNEYNPFTPENDGFICYKCKITFHIGEKKYHQLVYYDEKDKLQEINCCCDCAVNINLNDEIRNIKHFGCAIAACKNPTTEMFHLCIGDLLCQTHFAVCSKQCYITQVVHLHNRKGEFTHCYKCKRELSPIRHLCTCRKNVYCSLKCCEKDKKHIKVCVPDSIEERLPFKNN